MNNALTATAALMLTAAPVFAGVVVGFILPITVLTVVLVWLRQRRGERSAEGSS